MMNLKLQENISKILFNAFFYTFAYNFGTFFSDLIISITIIFTFIFILPSAKEIFLSEKKLITLL